MVQSSIWVKYVALIVLSVATPLLTASIHSAVVFLRGNPSRLYQAEFWRLPEQPDLWILFGIEALLTLSILLPCTGRPLLQRVLWACIVLSWMFVRFQAEAVTR